MQHAQRNPGKSLENFKAGELVRTTFARQGGKPWRDNRAAAEATRRVGRSTPPINPGTPELDENHVRQFCQHDKVGRAAKRANENVTMQHARSSKRRQPGWLKLILPDGFAA